MKASQHLRLLVILAVILSAEQLLAQDLGEISNSNQPTSSTTNSPPALESIRPSRFHLSNRAPLIEALVSRLNMTKRAIDPFGLPQDPDAPRPVATTTPQVATPVITRPPLSQALQGMSVNMVMPAKGSFMIGANTIQIGQTLSLKKGDTVYKAKVEKIDTRAITFRDQETQEIAELLLDLLPSQIQKGQNASESVPGMQRTNDAPEINLDNPSSN